jgi:gluconolactonase
MTPSARVVGENLGFTEGPVALADGRVACTSITHGAVYWIDPTGAVTSVETGGGANGLAYDGIDTYYVAQNGGIFGGKPGAEGGIQRIDRDGAVEYIVTGVDAPNDLCFGPDGRLYFTDSRAEGFDYADPATAPPGRLYSCTAQGEELRLLDEGPAFINGLAFGRDVNDLFVVETSARRILHYDWREGEVSNKTEAFSVGTGLPDGIAIDTEGALWVACTFDDHYVARFEQTGRRTARIDFRPNGGPTNCCFGIDSDQLFVALSRRKQLVAMSTGRRGLPMLTPTS